MAKHVKSILPLLGMAAMGCMLAAGPASAQSAEDFYKGKTINLLVGFPAGHGYDTTARLFMRHMVEHIPGKPSLVTRNMPGAGGQNVMAHTYNIAPRDGTTVTAIEQTLPLLQALGEKLQFDTTKVFWIGNQSAGTNILMTWAASGIKTIEDAQKREVTLGATGGGASNQPRLMNMLLGTKFKIITGYPGGNEISLAMERGEVEARTNTWASLKSVSRQWLNDGKVNVVVQIAARANPELPNVPLLMDLAKNDEDKTLLRLISVSATIGRSLVSTPEVPAARGAALRAAFDATGKDPAFIEDAAKAKIDYDFMSGAEMEKLVADVMSTPRPLAERLSKMLGDER